MKSNHSSSCCRYAKQLDAHCSAHSTRPSNDSFVPSRLGRQFRRKVRVAESRAICVCSSSVAAISTPLPFPPLLPSRCLRSMIALSAVGSVMGERAQNGRRRGRRTCSGRGRHRRVRRGRAGRRLHQRIWLEPVRRQRHDSKSARQKISEPVLVSKVLTMLP